MNAFDIVGWVREDGCVSCETDHPEIDEPIFAGMEDAEELICEEHMCFLEECAG